MTSHTRKAAPPTLIADDFLKVMVDQLIANLVCDEENVFDRVGDMPYPIQGQDLPQNMPFHQRVLDAVYDCSERPTSVYPTRANILMALGILYELRGPNAEAQLDAILAKRTRSGDVAGLSAYLWEAIENHRAQAIGVKFAQVLASGGWARRRNARRRPWRSWTGWYRPAPKPTPGPTRSSLERR